jgi:hypothetical protein
MDPKTLKIFLACTGLVVLIAIGIMWTIKATQPAGPRPGIDIPMRGM